MTSLPTTQRKVTLSEDMMKSIQAISRSPDLTPEVKLLAVIHLINGIAWFDSQETINPTNIQIPDTQWTKIATYLNEEGGADKIHRANLGLSFMNWGPSAFHEEDVKGT